MATDRKPEFFKGSQLKVAIIGCGYVGLPLALRFAEAGHKVTGFDTDPEKIRLSECRKVVHRTHSADEDSAVCEQPAFRRHSDFSRLREADAIIICVPTPLNEYREPDLSYVEETAKSIQPHLQKGPVGGSRIHHISRHDRRAGAADPRKKRPALPNCGRAPKMKMSQGISSWHFRRSAKIPAINNTVWRRFPKSWVA